MNNFIYKIMGLAIISTLLIACGGSGDNSNSGSGDNSNINFVKTGSYDDYPGTVGEAFDSWDICSSTSWDAFEATDGRSIVEYNCFVKKTGYRDLIEGMEGVDPDYAFEVMCAEDILLGYECNFSIEKYIQILKDGLTYIVQFTLYSDDTFAINYLGAKSPKVGEIDLSEYGLLYEGDFLDYVMYNDTYINDVDGDPLDILVTNLATYGN